MKSLALIGIVIFFILAGLFFTHTLGSINQDIGRHLKTGEIIWQTHQVPEVNLFSFTEPANEFINHHWLGEVIFYLLNLWIGLKGLIVFKTLILLGALWMLYGGIKSKARPIAFIVALATSLIMISGRADVRPEIFSYLFMAYFLFAIFKTKYELNQRWLWGLPILQLIWTNTHIYFIFGPMIMAIFALERYVNKDGSWRKMAALCGLCCLVTLINPNMLAGALAPLTIFSDYGYSIVENQSVFFLNDYGVMSAQINYFILISLVFIASFIPGLRKYGFKSYFFETILSIIFIVLGAKMVRNFGPLAIVMLPIFAINIQAYLERKALRIQTYRWLYASACVIGIFLISSVLTSRAYGIVGSADRFGLEIPASAQGGVDFVLSNKIDGPVFNNFDVGSYLIWKLYPEQKVFVDGRPEAYSSDFFENIYKPMQEDPKVWEYYANDVYQINYVLFDYHDITPWAQTFLSFMLQNKNWATVYQDDSVIILLRRVPHNLPIIQKHKSLSL